MVTASGIILGFVLNFASAFVKSESSVGDGLAYAIGALILVGLGCLIVVLTRALRMGIAPEQAAHHYNKTLIVFVFGVTCSVAGVLLDLASNFFDS